MWKVKSIIFASIAAVGLSGCLETDGERALVGAAGGCLANEVLRDGDCVNGALVGAVGGALFDDVTGR